MSKIIQTIKYLLSTPRTAMADPLTAILPTRPALLPALLLTLLLSACGNNRSEFDSVITETIVEFEGTPEMPQESTQEPTPDKTAKTADAAGEKAAAEATRTKEKDLKPGDKIVVRKIKAGPRNHDRIRLNNIGLLREIFNDSNYLQLEHAKRLGIQPIFNIRDLYRTRRPIVRVNSCRYYTVDSLKHSFPYLVPEAEALLRKVGANFIDSLGARGADGYKIIATSLLRTPMSVKRLRRVNVNATDSSTHRYGTTFDISYIRFDCADSTRTIHEGDLKNLLAEVLFDLRREGRCLVKFERKTGCFHITATR